LLIYIILGGLLRSYLQPFVIMDAIPFGVIGAIFGHFALGHDLTFISLFGLVALSGVVVNDSVVLLDYLNRQLGNGKGIIDSALLAVRRRFRPILLTTLSTCLGLLPMLLETSMQAQFLIPMVVSLATGILFATPIILVLVPCILIIAYDIRQGFQNIFQQKASKPALLHQI
jgi:multidrug efflux pump subunit AcrB